VPTIRCSPIYREPPRRKGDIDIVCRHCVARTSPKFSLVPILFGLAYRLAGSDLPDVLLEPSRFTGGGQGVETAAQDVTKNRSGRRWLAERRPAECGLVPAKTREAPRSAPSPDENENAGGTPMTKSPDGGNPRSDDTPDQASRSTAESIGRAVGNTDFLVSGAAGNFLAPINEPSPNSFRVVVDINRRGTAHPSWRSTLGEHDCATYRAAHQAALRVR
jgi:hypothetical protein